MQEIVTIRFQNTMSIEQLEKECEIEAALRKKISVLEDAAKKKVNKNCKPFNEEKKIS